MADLREVGFELERFSWIAPGRLELRGRWSGLEGRRLGRPVLTIEAAGVRRRDELAELRAQIAEPRAGRGAPAAGSEAPAAEAGDARDEAADARADAVDVRAEAAPEQSGAVLWAGAARP